MRASCIAIVALTACGRLHFDPLADADDCGFTFCDDFDRAPPVTAGWDDMTVSGPITFDLSTDTVTSTPQSLAIGFSAIAQGFLVKQLGDATSYARAAFELAYDTTNATGCEADLVRLRWLSPPAPCTSFGYFLVRDGQTNSFDLQETYTNCGGNENTAFSDLVNTGFHRVDLIVTFGTANGTARVRVDVDGTTLVDKPTSHDIAPGTIVLDVGAGPIRNVNAPWTVHYDDVIGDIR